MRAQDMSKELHDQDKDLVEIDERTGKTVQNITEVRRGMQADFNLKNKGKCCCCCVLIDAYIVWHSVCPWQLPALGIIKAMLPQRECHSASWIGLACCRL